MVIYMDRSQSCNWIQGDMQPFCMNLIAWSGPQHEHGTIIQTLYFLTKMKKLLKSKIDFLLFLNSLKKILQWIRKAHYDCVPFP